MENDRGTEETWSDWDSGNRNMATGAILASAVAAGALAFIIHRRRQAQERTLSGMTSRAAEAARSAIGDHPVSAGRDFLTDTVLPEFKPALLALLEEVEDAVSQGFRKAERAVKDL